MTSALAGASFIRFSTMMQSGIGPVLTTHYGNANVMIVDSISGAAQTGPFNWAAERWAQTTNWNANIAISAGVAEPTTGYKLTIKRVTMQRIGRRLAQFCVVASVAPPGSNAAVLQRRSWAVHVVRLRRRGFHPLPKVVVLRRTDGSLLATGYTARPSYLAGDPVPRPSAALCRA